MLTAVFLAALGRNQWFDNPISVQPGLTLVDEMSPGVDEAMVHVRLSVDASRPSKWGLIWGYRDADNFCRAILSLPAADRNNDLYRQRSVIQVHQVAGGVEKLVLEREMLNGVDVDGRFNSLKLVYADGCARLFAGDSYETEIGEVPFDASGGAVLIYSDGVARCQRISASASCVPQLEPTRFGDIDELLGYLADASDRVEGVWEYMDRNLDRDKAVLGGFYTLAVVRDGDSYEILYIKGADIDRDRWYPLMTKGRLTPTIFRGNYDMVWYDTRGRLISEDVNAQLSDDGAVLTLRFPILDTQLRFRRVIID